MKLKFFIAAYILLNFSGPFTSLFAQDYTPFFIAQSKWVMSKVYPIIGPGDGYVYWENYTLQDTLVEGKTYTILARRNLCSSWPDMSGELHADPTLNTNEMIVGGLREENKKVFVINFGNNTEQLLYDFDVVVGDTIHFTPTVFTIIRALNPPVDGLVNYTVTNSTAFSYPFETGTLSEGFGSSYGLFGSYDSYLTDLLCFARDEEADSLEYQCTPCSQYVTVNTQDPIMTGAGNVNIYPNPTHSILTLQTNREVNIQEISIMDVNCKLLERISCSDHQVEIDLSALPASILILAIQLDNKHEVVKRVLKY